jgi:methionyl-tRNA formyltransferase
MPKGFGKTIILVGDGRMAQESLQILEEHPGTQVAAVIHHVDPPYGFKRLRPVDRSNSGKFMACENINQSHVVSWIADFQPDLILSVNNFDIIRSEILSIPKDGIINFHNGPLPAYRGLNIPSWAIINGEEQHGVTWHFVDQGVDSGPIAAQAYFRLSQRETAISLIFKCIDMGLQLLPSLLDDYIGGQLEPKCQQGVPTYFPKSRTPNGGKIDFSLPCARINRFVRGLTFHPFPNSFVPAHFATHGGDVVVGDATCLRCRSSKSSGKPGRIVEVADDGLIVWCNDGYVALKYLTFVDGRCLNSESLKSECGLAPDLLI